MRTEHDLQRSIDEDLVWRRRESFNIRTLIEGSSDNRPREAALLRAGVAMLYARWEGFIKKTGTLYLQYIANQGHKGSELKVNFLAIKFKKQLNQASSSKKSTASHEIVEYFCTQLNNQIKLPHKGVIDTQSNLTSTVLSEIVATLGLDFQPFETRKHLIDTRLVNQRNHIAHGDTLGITPTEFVELYDTTFAMMDEFRNQVQNAAAVKSHLRPAHP